MDLAYEVHALTAMFDIHAEAYLAARGVSFTQHKILAVIESEAPTTGRHVATCLRLTPAAVSKNVAPLKDQGLVVDRREPGMGNVQQLHLTPSGATFLRDFASRLSRPLDEVCVGLGLDPDALARDLERVTAVLKEDAYASTIGPRTAPAARAGDAG